jgi:glycosyltransferase involved in cell wall biosynthesis
MEKVLIYFPFALEKKADSGSKVRPLKMIEAFQTWGDDRGFEVIVVSGESKERAEKWDELLRNDALQDVRCCYVENRTIPIWLTDKNHIPSKPFIDQKVCQYLKQRKIPIGIFYRDVYWKFDELYPLKGIKKRMMQWLYRREEKFYEKYADAIFLPSSEMGKYVNIERAKVALPPGGKEVVFQEASRDDRQVRAIYVGAVQHADNGLPLLLATFEQIKEEGLPLSLTLVCRETEYQGLDVEQKEQINTLGVDVKHLSGPALDALYTEMDFAYLPRIKSTYNDFSVPVKLVEYLSSYLPVIASNCTAQQQFVECGPYGVISEATIDNMVKATKIMMKQHNTYLETIQERFLREHSWLARVETVYETLTKSKTEPAK